MTSSLRIADVRGREFTFHSAPRRVVSLVPSLTETLFELGAGQAVAGISDFCIFPEGLALPRVGGTKNPRIDEIRALAPDLVHMNMEENTRRHAEAIEQFAPVFVTEPKNVDDVAELFTILGAIHRRERRAAELVRELDAARFTVAPFTFAVPIWKSPWMWCGGDTYVSALVESCGGRNVLRDLTRYPSMSVEDVLAKQPEIIFLPDEPYAFTEADAAAMLGGGGLVRPIVGASGDARTPFRRPTIIGPFPGHLFTWHGVRTILGLRFLRLSTPARAPSGRS